MVLKPRRWIHFSFNFFILNLLCDIIKGESELMDLLLKVTNEKSSPRCSGRIVLNLREDVEFRVLFYSIVN